MNQQELRQLIDRAATEKWTELDLHDKGLTEFPSEIGRLISLTKLNLSNNNIRDVPPAIGQLTNLKSLLLHRNNLMSVSSEIGQLINLTVLSLEDNQLRAIPPEIGQLSNLTELGLEINKLAEIPVEIFQLTKLTVLTLNRNQLKNIPSEIGQLIRLTSLQLWGNRLNAIPTEIGQLISLTKIDLNDNELTTIPSEIGQLKGLTLLLLSRNQLTTIPSGIGQLASLIELDLSGNEIAQLPPEIGQLTNLRKLRLGRVDWGLTGNFSEFPFEIGTLTNLITLDLSANNLTTIPPEIGQMISLTHLYLSSNQLTSISQEIGKLKNLSWLDLSSNQLSQLPSALQRLPKLRSLDLLYNPLLDIPVEILEQYYNPELILKTYFGERRPLREAKMLLVGQGSVGKTALARRLLHDLPPEEGQGKTEGVDIQKWSFAPAGADEPITLNLWDFGGQGVYQATHQFFFTSRSLYLVIINARTGEQESRLRHWLKLVGSLSNNAPVIIVVNKQDEHVFIPDERELKHKYPNLLHIIPTSCTTGQGIPELRQAIAAALSQLPHINDQFPTAWFGLKAQLEAMDSNYITYERYAEYCREAGIDSLADQRSWVQVLHQLGVVLNYQDDKFRQLEGTHVLKPEWVTDGVYRILSDPDGRIAQNSGILTAAMLDNILDPDNYPRHQQHFIVAMMQKFELSFRIPNRQDQYLIPDLLPNTQPELAAIGFAPDVPALQLQIQYTEFLPGSILSRFMVGMMAVLDRQASWRQGAVLSFEENRALVQADLEARKIFITITGTESTRRSLLNTVRMQFHAIHNTFPNLPLTEQIPIPDQPNKTIAYHALCNLEAKGIEQYYDPVNDVELDVKQLLAGIETPALRRERQIQESLLAEYDLEGLQQLCFDLGVEYENLPGEIKSAKTRGLVQFMGRQGRLDHLEEQLKFR